MSNNVSYNLVWLYSKWRKLLKSVAVHGPFNDRLSNFNILRNNIIKHAGCSQYVQIIKFVLFIFNYRKHFRVIRCHVYYSSQAPLHIIALSTVLLIDYVFISTAQPEQTKLQIESTIGTFVFLISRLKAVCKTRLRIQLIITHKIVAARSN